jgi:molecular chaperone GrpE
MNENVHPEEQNMEDLNGAQQATAEGPAKSDDTPENAENEVENLKNQVAELKDKYLRLVADFDNFRKRSAKERLELIQTASKDLITSLLTVLDDSERAEKQMQVTQDIDAIKEGEKLVFNKLRNTLQSKGLRAMETVGEDFNPEFHEAITEIPAPNDSLKGKVLDEVEKGYYLNDKIIRFAKVVVGK